MWRPTTARSLDSNPTSNQSSSSPPPKPQPRSIFTSFNHRLRFLSTARFSSPGNRPLTLPPSSFLVLRGLAGNGGNLTCGFGVVRCVSSVSSAAVHTFLPWKQPVLCSEIGDSFGSGGSEAELEDVDTDRHCIPVRAFVFSTSGSEQAELYSDDISYD